MSEKTIATNKKAYHDYFIEETYEAGIELVGSEVKSIRSGAINLKDSYAAVKNGETEKTQDLLSQFGKDADVELSGEGLSALVISNIAPPV